MRSELGEKYLSFRRVCRQTHVNQTTKSTPLGGALVDCECSGRRRENPSLALGCQSYKAAIASSDPLSWPLSISVITHDALFGPFLYFSFRLSNTASCPRPCLSSSTRLAGYKYHPPHTKQISWHCISAPNLTTSDLIIYLVVI